MPVVTYRIVPRANETFVIEVLADGVDGWRTVDSYRTKAEAEAQRARLEKIVQNSVGRT